MELNGLKEEHYINKIAPKDTKMYLEVMFWSYESYVSLYLLDLENETFSQHYPHNKFRTIFDFKRSFTKSRLNSSIGSIVSFEMLIKYAW